MSTHPFLRSINIRFDAGEPERISHFVPTTKCVSLLKALLGLEKDRAFFIVAPYGSGKSLTACYLLHHVENRAESQDALRTIERKLTRVSPQLAASSTSRRRSKKP